jgi:hypothetical protein
VGEGLESSFETGRYNGDASALTTAEPHSIADDGARFLESSIRFNAKLVSESSITSSSTNRGKGLLP